MILYTRKYDSANVSKTEYDRFVSWAERNAAKEVSAWRHRHVGDDDHWYITVVDESEDEATLSFDWNGEPYKLTAAEAEGFAYRRLERQATAYLEGHRTLREKIHYGDAVAPRMRDGVWFVPTGGQG